MALLLPVNSDAPPIAGVLIDGGEGGFRAAHSCRRFTTESGRQFYPSIPGRRGSSDLESLGQVRILKPALSIWTMPTPSTRPCIQRLPYRTPRLDEYATIRCRVICHRKP